VVVKRHDNTTKALQPIKLVLLGESIQLSSVTTTSS